MKHYFLINLLFFLIFFNGVAQTKKYVSYTVKKGETIKSIAKDLNISPKELLDLNPDVDKKPKENTVILIAVEVKETKPETIQYQVLPKETLYGIAKKYQLSIEEILQLNPILVHGLKEGQIIELPKTNLTTTPVITPVIEPQKITHTIEKGDTLYNLTKRYQISEADLIAQNPILKEGFNIGMVLSFEPGKKTEIIPNLAHKPIVKKNANLKLKSGKTVNVVMMLPFMLDEINDINVNFNNPNSLLNITTEFYQGAIIAIDSLRNQGANIRLKTFDSENTFEKISSILKTTNLSDTDVFIGPLFLANAYKLAKSINSGFVVAPMKSKEHSKFNESNLIKSGVSDEMLENNLLQFIKRNYTNQQLIVIGDNKQGANNEADRIAWKLKVNSNINQVTVLNRVMHSSLNSDLNLF